MWRLGSAQLVDLTLDLTIGGSNQYTADGDWRRIRQDHFLGKQARGHPKSVRVAVEAGTHKGDCWSAITADQYHSQATINK